MIDTETSGETDFGFRRVREEEKAPLVRGVFDSVAARYDLMNDLMSGGIHRRWKAAMVAWLAPRPGQLLVDIAGGTGDVALRALPRLVPGGGAFVCDINRRMLEVGRARAIDDGVLAGLEWVCADAERLLDMGNVPETKTDRIEVDAAIGDRQRLGVAAHPLDAR